MDANDLRDYEVICDDGEEHYILASSEQDAWDEATERGYKPASITELEPL